MMSTDSPAAKAGAKPGVGLVYGPPLSPPPNTHSSDLGAYLRLMWQVCVGQIAVPQALKDKCLMFYRSNNSSWQAQGWDGQPTQVEMTGGNLAGLTAWAQPIAVQIYEIITPVGTPSKPGQRVPNAPWWWLAWVETAGKQQPVEKREAVLRDLWTVFRDSKGAPELLVKINAALVRLGAQPIQEKPVPLPVDDWRVFVFADLEMLLGKEIAEAVWQLGSPAGERKDTSRDLVEDVQFALAEPLPPIDLADTVRGCATDLLTVLCYVETRGQATQAARALGHCAELLEELAADVSRDEVKTNRSQASISHGCDAIEQRDGR